MKKSFAIIGLGRFGLGIVKTLSELKCDVLAIDVRRDSVEKAAEYNNHCVICDATKKANLKELGINNIDHAVVAIGNNLQSTILTTINLKELGVPHITVRVDEEEYISVMERLGATDVIIPEEASSISLANQIVSDNVLDYYKVKKEYSMMQIKVRKLFKARTLIDIDSRNKYNVNIVGIIRNEEFFIPKGTDEIRAEDILLIIGKTNNIIKFDNSIND